MHTHTRTFLHGDETKPVSIGNACACDRPIKPAVALRPSSSVVAGVAAACLLAFLLLLLLLPLALLLYWAAVPSFPHRCPISRERERLSISLAC